MNVNDKITVKGVSYTVMNTIGSGGQGSIWKVVSSADNKTYALKILHEKDVNKHRNKVVNIQRLVNEKLQQKIPEIGKAYGVNHVFPIGYYVDPKTHETGYIMQYVNGKTLNAMLLSGEIEKMSINEKLALLKRVASSIDILHSMGYCYTDINWGNFMWNEKEDMLYVIDCENVAYSVLIDNGTCAFLTGTGFFIAPEVAFGRAFAAYNSDKYALATLIFRVLTNNVLQSAYHGVAMYSSQPACQTMVEVAERAEEDDIDENWCKFVFDPNDHSNGIDNLCKDSKTPENKAFRKQLESVMKIWDNLDERLKKLFYKSFINAFDDKSRPLPSTWAKEIDKVLKGKISAHVQTVKNQVAVKPVSPVNCQTAKTLTPVTKFDINKKYRAFKPSGTVETEQPIQATLPQGAYLLSSCGKTVELVSDVFEIDGEALGMAQKHIGQLQKTENGYIFLSALLSAVEVFGANGELKDKLYKGKSTVLESGDSIKPVVSSVSIKLTY